MKEYGTRPRYQIRNFEKAEDLDPEKVEFGIVKIIPGLQIDGRTEAVLLVGPKSKVAWHTHIYDNESYVVMDHADETGLVISEVCSKGNGHELENLSEDKWLIVKSVKWV